MNKIKLTKFSIKITTLNYEKRATTTTKKHRHTSKNSNFQLGYGDESPGAHSAHAPSNKSRFNENWLDTIWIRHAMCIRIRIKNNNSNYTGEQNFWISLKCNNNDCNGTVQSGERMLLNYLLGLSYILCMIHKYDVIYLYIEEIRWFCAISCVFYLPPRLMQSALVVFAVAINVTVPVLLLLLLLLRLLSAFLIFSLVID